MKITILGRGNAGCISALHFYHYINFFKLNIEIELLYDSKIPPVPVGQATTLDLVNFLWASTETKNLINFEHTQKKGIMYENWGKKNKKWFHEFPFGSYAIHFNPKTFQDYVINNLKINFKEVDENVINYDKIDSDFIIDCRGAPNDMKEYDSLINPLNCALLSSLPVDKDILWTRTVATPDGWCFYIPLQDRVSVGYLFNKSITTENEAENNFKKLFNVEKINKVFNFNQYVAKKPIINERVFLNGNKLFFLEPLEATAMNVYQKWCRYIWDCIIAKKHNFNFAENEIKNYINQIQNFILWHYGSGSMYDTSFWEHAKNMYQKNKSIEFEKIINETNQYSSNFLKNNNFMFPYAQWTGWNTKNWCEGMGI
jgi:hypothetical protein